MSTIFVSVGQCGNQLANCFLDYVIENQTAQTSYLFNHFDNKYHFINVDSEIKVINQLLTQHGNHLRQENVLNTKCGRGSNWAAGYGGRRDGALKIIEATLEATRREAERCDFLLNLNIMHSLSGGTGSGCGSKLIEELRNEFGAKKYFFTQSVAPFHAGELPLQHYNNLLCISHLHEFVDSVFLIQNDDILSILEKTLHDSQNTKVLPSIKMGKPKANESAVDSVSLAQMNHYIIKSLLGLIFPVDSVSLKTQSIGMEMFELQRLLCPNPNMKIVEVYNVNGVETLSANLAASRLNAQGVQPKSNPLLKTMMATFPKYNNNSGRHFASVQSLIVTRGSNTANDVSTLWNDYDLIKKCLNPVEWNPFPIDFWSSKHALNEIQANNKQSSRTSPISLTFALNRNKCVDYLKVVRDKAAEKYAHKAYLHWYTKFDVDASHFNRAFENMQHIIDTYEQMTL